MAVIALAETRHARAVRMVKRAQIVRTYTPKKIAAVYVRSLQLLMICPSLSDRQIEQVIDICADDPDVVVVVNNARLGIPELRSV